MRQSSAVVNCGDLRLILVNCAIAPSSTANVKLIELMKITLAHSESLVGTQLSIACKRHSRHYEKEKKKAGTLLLTGAFNKAGRQRDGSESEQKYYKSGLS
jgi:hypothetical protein